MEAKLVFTPYTYRVDVTLAGNGSAPAPLQLDPDADFELHYIMGSSDQDAATNFYNNNFSVTITDKGNSRFWSNARIDQKILCGPDNGGLPLRRPVLFAAKSNLSFDFLDLSGNANVASVYLSGFKVYSR